MQIGFVIATKDRPADLRRTLRSLAEQSSMPRRVIVVDGGDNPVNTAVSEFDRKLDIAYVRHTPASAAAQRNAGVKMVSSDCELIGFIDDDAELEPSALERMAAFWREAAPNIGGCAFNLINHPPMRANSLKRSRLAETLGLYSAKPGLVLPSGWQTMIGRVAETIFVDWLPSTAVVWRTAVLKEALFDEFFTGYSYLEDLDLSFAIRRHWRLVVLAEAGYTHNPSPLRHLNNYHFGRREILNRLHFVRKHNLSLPRCWLLIAGRLGMTLSHAALYFDANSIKRAAGNLAEIKSSLIH